MKTDRNKNRILGITAVIILVTGLTIGLFCGNAEAQWDTGSPLGRQQSSIPPTTLLKEIIASGGNIVVDTSIPSTLLKELAALAAKNRVRLVIRKAGDTPTTLLKEIARAGQGYVTFDFTR